MVCFHRETNCKTKSVILAFGFFKALQLCVKLLEQALTVPLNNVKCL